MKKNMILMLISMLVIIISIEAKNVTPNQYYYIIKQVFPEKSKVNVFMEKETYKKIKKDIQRASTIFKMETKVYSIDSPRDIGKYLREIKNENILLVFPDELFESSRFKLFILKKAKEKGIYLVSGYQSYCECGALMSILNDEITKKTKVLLNLELYPNLKLTEQLITALNAEVIK